MPLMTASADPSPAASATPTEMVKTSTPSSLSREAATADIFESVFGRKEVAPEAMQYPVIVEGSNYGEALVRPATNEANTTMRRADIFKLIFPILTEEKAKELRNRFGKQVEITTAELQSVGIDARFDRKTLSYMVEIALHDRSEVPLALQRRRNPVANLQTLAPATTSMAVNLIGGTTYIHSSDLQETGFAQTQVNLQVAANHKKFVLETGLLYNEQDGVNLDLTRVTRDLIEKQIRLEAGDLRAPIAGLQTTMNIAGLSAYKNFDTKPYEEYRSNPSQQFELEAPARVRVYMNGQFVREFRLRPGRYRLTDLPLRSAGGNDVQLDILYDSGETRQFTFSAFYDFELLQKGISDWGFSAGPTSRFLDGQRRYDTGDIAASGYYRLGLSDRLTLGINSQINNDVFIAGGEALLATQLGTFGVFNAVSQADGLTGNAVNALYRWNGADRRKQQTFDLLARWEDDSYREQNDPFSETQYEWDVSARYSAEVGNDDRISLSSGWRRRRLDNVEEFSHTATYSRRFRKGTLSANVRYDDGGEFEGLSAGISYAISFGKGSAFAGHDTRNQASRASYIYNPGRGTGALGYDIALSQQSRIEDLRAGIDYTGNRFEARAEHFIGNRQPGQSFGNESMTSVFGGTGIVYADGRAALSRPVYDSFAMVEANKGAEDFELAADPIGDVLGTDWGFTAKSSSLGPAVVPDLQSYYLRSISVSAPDAPTGVSFDGNTFDLLPTYRSGFRLKVGSDRNVSAVSRLIDTDGKPVSFASGYVMRDDGEIAPMFTNGGGVFYISELRAGQKVVIEFENPSNHIAEFTIPEDAVGLVRIDGDIVMRETKGGSIRIAKTDTSAPEVTENAS